MELRRKEPAARRREKRFFDQFRCQSGKIVLNRADRQRVVPDYLIIVEASEKEVAIFPVAGLQQTVSASDGERVVHINDSPDGGKVMKQACCGLESVMFPACMGIGDVKINVFHRIDETFCDLLPAQFRVCAHQSAEPVTARIALLFLANQPEVVSDLRSEVAYQSFAADKKTAFDPAGKCGGDSDGIDTGCFQLRHDFLLSEGLSEKDEGFHAAPDQFTDFFQVGFGVIAECIVSIVA